MAGSTTRPAYGRLMALKFAGTTILNLKATSLKQSRGKRDVTTKDSNDNSESRPTIIERSYDFSALMPLDGPNAAGGPALETAFDAGTIGLVAFGDGLSGSPNWSASGFLTALNFDAPYDGNVEYTGTLQITGVNTFSTT